MFDFSSVRIQNMVIHKVGNKLRDEGVFVSPNVYDMKDSNVEELLLKYFLSPFKDSALYNFDVDLSNLYLSVSRIFSSHGEFYDESVKILNHLYNKSSHPQIRGGEFYMVHFVDCIINDCRTDAIGIFKTEKKETYLKITQCPNELIVGSEKCINVKKLDKGCIIFNTNCSDGYRVAIVDNAKKSSVDDYWKEDFLQVVNVQDDYFQTENCLAVCQDFVENIYGEIYQADRKEKVVMMNDVIDYFNIRNEFDLDDFAHDVIKEPELIEQFKEHKQNFAINQGIESTDCFTISTSAVKAVKRKFKSLIKLDTEFEIKVKNPNPETGNMQYLERGFDEGKGMNFYKVYFNVEE